MPDDVGTFNVEGVQQRIEVIGVIGETEMTGWGRTGDITGAADSHHSDVREFGPRRDGNEPVRKKAGVDKHHGLAVSLIGVLDLRVSYSKAFHVLRPILEPYRILFEHAPVASHAAHFR